VDARGAIPPNKPGGNKRSVNVREVMNGIMYIPSTGCQWLAIPKDLPPCSTLFDYLDLWSYDGTIDRIHHTLYVAYHEQSEREASPTAAIIDSQSVKNAEKRGSHLSTWLWRGQIKEKKRQVVVNALGLLLHAQALLKDIGITTKWEFARFLTHGFSRKILDQALAAMS
jgi:putative transposase